MLALRHNGVGHAGHCHELVVARDQFIDGNGKRWRVDASDAYAETARGSCAEVMGRHGDIPRSCPLLQRPEAGVPQFRDQA